jgi:hypothetical protein
MQIAGPFATLPIEVTQKIMFASGLGAKDTMNVTSTCKTWYENRFEKMVNVSPQALSSILCILLKKEGDQQKKIQPNKFGRVIEFLQSFVITQPTDQLLRNLSQVTYSAPLCLSISTLDGDKVHRSLCAVLKKFPNTEELVCDFRLNAKNFTSLMTHSVMLKRLRVPLYDRYDYTILKKLPHLEELRGLSTVDDAGLQEILDSCPKLHTLVIHSRELRGELFTNATKKYTNIQCLHLNCEALHASGLQNLISLFPNLVVGQLVVEDKARAMIGQRAGTVSVDDLREVQFPPSMQQLHLRSRYDSQAQINALVQSHPLIAISLI